jgi:hypothetical protein
VVQLREEGLSFGEIGEKRGIHKMTARDQWLRHLRNLPPSPPLDYKGKGL